MSERTFKFRGYDSPSIEGEEVYFGAGEFTVGQVYQADDIEHEEDDDIRTHALFVGDDGRTEHEEFLFFDEVTDE